MLIAISKYEHLFGVELQPTEVVLVCDTPQDVMSAQGHDVRALAVATGEHSRNELAAATWVVPNLHDSASVLSLLRGEDRSVE